MECDFLMGLAAISAMPIVAAAALLCAPLAWLYNWYLAGPIYAEAEMQFERAGDARNALYAKIGRLRSEWETMSFPEVSEYLATALESPLVQKMIRSSGSGFSMRRERWIWKSTSLLPAKCTKR